MEPRSTITTLRTNHDATPNPHSHDPCAWPPIKVRVAPLHPTSLSHIRPAARCPASVTCGPILGYSESVSPWNVYLNHCHYQQECLRRSIYTHSLFDTPDSVPRTLPDLWPDHTSWTSSPSFLLVDSPHSSSSLLAPTRSHAWTRQTPVLHLGSQIRWSCASLTKADLSNLATSPWYKQTLADPSSMHHHSR
jgi:hypothetical protein